MTWTRQMQCKITCLCFAARGRAHEQDVHLATARFQRRADEALVDSARRESSSIAQIQSAFLDLASLCCVLLVIGSNREGGTQ